MEPQGSILGLPPVADDDRQTLVADYDEDRKRHHVESKPQTITAQMSQASGKPEVGAQASPAIRGENHGHDKE